MFPLPSEAPEMVPVVAPAVHTNVFPVVPAVEEVSGKLTAPQVVTVFVEVITGVGFTVTVTSVGAAERQEPMLLGEVARTE